MGVPGYLGGISRWPIGKDLNALILVFKMHKDILRNYKLDLQRDKTKNKMGFKGGHYINHFNLFLM